MAENENEKAAATLVAAALAETEREELPKTIVRRIVKEKLSQLSTDSEMSVLREALLAFSESAIIFIHYLSAAANDICKESKRQTMNAEDVFKALEEIEFSEFVGPLRASLEELRKKNAGKRSGSSKAKESNKKVKKKDSPEVNEDVEEDEDIQQNGDEEIQQNDDEDMQQNDDESNEGSD